ncbi:mechanosensitive ion channel family protein [Isoptericola sp. b441]|uniref:Mechanosensitive ion channel family protein n=1 Tax=Actinotalea lenta TaxID=3064654 RepID=A0ABT9D8M3_9CELL|nr:MULTISPECIES: mechanosensitive ion channel family protein [unclassified Isoptericola]MDO8107242.1 mechanosensitive ion channel family protein [Isoptericola sp. b441]MDO8121095.1 mechanosensitive ion channel family protein [Isoptericola sp. b490]
MPVATTALPAAALGPLVPAAGVSTVVGDEASRWYDWLIGAPLQTLITLAVAGLVLVLLRWIIRRAVRSVVEGSTHVRKQARRLLLRSGIDAPADDPLVIARRVQRAETMGSVLRSSAALLVGIVAITVLANIWGWDLGPLLASAGVAGVALGFGAQTLVKDFLSGLFMLVEDQYGVGDVVDLGDATGVVEAIGLRVTQIRDLQGTLWYVRNGEVMRVGNLTQGWSRAFVEVLVTPDQDIEAATEALRTAAASLADDPDVAPQLLDEPAVTAYEDLSAESVRLRTMVKTVPGQQWAVQRVLRGKIRDAFAGSGVMLALPHREVHVRPGLAALTPASAGADAGSAESATSRTQDQNSKG